VAVFTAVFTSKTGAVVLGIKQDTLKHYATKFGIGMQPGGPGTPWIFTLEELSELRERVQKWEKVEAQEDRDVLGLGPLYNPDASPRR